MRAPSIAGTWLSMVLLTLLSGRAAAGTWSVEPSYRALFGDTSYELEARVSDPEGSGEVEARSFLEFPLDTHIVGISANWEADESSARPWIVSAGVFTNLGDPGDTMSDDDWLDGVQIASTRSDVELDVFRVSAEVRWRVRQSERTELWVVTGVDYHALSFDAIGYDGWIVEESGVQHDVSGDEAVLDYEVSYLTPEFGALYAISLSDGVALSLGCAGGLAFASDEVDHLLRGKRSEASGVGGSLSTSVELCLTPMTLIGGRGSLELFGGFRYLRVDGDQTQRWYESDGSVPAGTVIDGIPHTFESAQFTLGAALRVRL